MSQQNPLEELLAEILNSNGFDKLDEETKREYMPQFMAQAEQRVGAALLPLLNQESASKFVELSQKESTPDEWWNFWQENVPNFSEVVRQSLMDFAAEVKQSMVF